MRRRIPSTGALMAFEAAARHESFTKAALELSLTQSAICRQIAGLEALLGVRLFHRTKRGVALTEGGLTYSRQVALRLDAVERDTLDLMSGRGLGGTLELAVVPTFATKWLMPRLALFQRERPDITINLSTRTRPFLFNETEFDAAIQSCDTNWPGTEAHFLMQESLAPVCSPDLLPEARALAPQEVCDYPLLQQSTRPYAWREWFGSLDMTVGHDMTGPRYELFSMSSQAAMQGMGIALIPPLLIEDELRAGSLMIAAEHRYVGKRSYYFIYPERKSESVALNSFRDWLDGAAGKYRAMVD